MTINCRYYAYDQARAKALLAEAGYPQGPDVTLTVISREIDKLQSEVLKQMLDAIGIRTTVDVLERAAWVQRLVDGGEEFHFGTMRNPRDTSDPDLDWRKYFTVKGDFDVAHMDDSQLNTALDAANAVYDAPTRSTAYSAVLKGDYELASYGYMWFQKWNWASSKALHDWQPRQAGWDFRGVWRTG